MNYTTIINNTLAPVKLDDRRKSGGGALSGEERVTLLAVVQIFSSLVQSNLAQSDEGYCIFLVVVPSDVLRIWVVFSILLSILTVCQNIIDLERRGYF